MDKPIVINLFGGPGTGKSTIASGVYCLLKMHRIDCEYVTEFAKDLVWEKRFNTMENQIYVFAKQFHKHWRLTDQVKVIITDSPLLFSLYYGSYKPQAFIDLVTEIYKTFDNMNYLIKRLDEIEYIESGRQQDKNQACDIDNSLKSILDDLGASYTVINHSSEDRVNKIVKDLLDRFGLEIKYKLTT